jgi:leader peptidase (prepilin peptidase) / N-methyltransferase
MRLPAAAQFCRRPFGGDRPLSAEGRAGLIAVGCCMVLASLTAAPDADGAFGGALALLMLAIAAADHRYFIIPDALSGAAFAIGLIHAAVGSQSLPEGAWTSLWRGLITGGALLLFRFAYYRLRGREGIGIGDVKLAAVAGAWLTLPTIIVSVEIAALAALGTYVVQQLRRSRALSATARLPFGLFFAPAIWLGWLFEAISANSPFSAS